VSVRLTRDLVAEGCSHNELAQRTRAGVLTRVRRGACVDGWPSDPTVRHLRLVEATWQLNAVDAVVSHLSAAVVHGLPVASTSLGPVQLTRDNAPGGKIRGAVHLYATTLDADEVIELQGLRVNRSRARSSTSGAWCPSSSR
jgi:hypothetical protein